MSFTPLSFEPSPEALIPRYPFDLEWTALREDDGLKDADDGNFFDAYEDYLQSQAQEEQTVAAVPEEPEDDIFDTELTDEPLFQPKPWCKNPKSLVFYQNYAEYLAEAKRQQRSLDRIKSEEQFRADCQGAQVLYDKKPEAKKGRIPDWATKATHQDVIDFYTEKDAQGKMKRRWPPPAKTFGKNIKIKQEWEDLADVYGEVRKREKEAQKRFIQEKRSRRDD